MGSRGPVPRTIHTKGPAVNSQAFLWGLCLLWVPAILEGPEAENNGYAAEHVHTQVVLFERLARDQKLEDGKISLRSEFSLVTD